MRDQIKADLCKLLDTLSEAPSTIQAELIASRKLLSQAAYEIQTFDKSEREAKEEVCLFLTKIEEANPQLFLKKFDAINQFIEKYHLDDEPTLKATFQQSPPK